MQPSSQASSIDPSMSYQSSHPSIHQLSISHQRRNFSVDFWRLRFVGSSFFACIRRDQSKFEQSKSISQTTNFFRYFSSLKIFQNNMLLLEFQFMHCIANGAKLSFASVLSFFGFNFFDFFEIVLAFFCCLSKKFL